MSMKVAIVGVSHWHTAMHLPALQDAGANVCAVADSDLSVAARVAAPLNAKHYGGLVPLLEKERPELVLVMGRPVEVAKDAAVLIDAGIPGIIEKPIGLTAGDVAPLARQAKAKGVFMTVPLVNRYSALWKKLDEFARKSDFRRLHAHFRVVNGFPFRYRRMGVEWMLDPGVSGGGPLRNLGIHTIDAFLQFTAGEEVRVKSASLHGSIEEPSIEDFATATLETPSGVIGTIETGYSLAAGAGSDTEWRVATTKAYLVDRNQTLRIADIDAGIDEVVEIPSVRQRYDEFALDTIARVREGREPKVGLDEFLRATRLVDEVYSMCRASLTVTT